MGRGVFQAPIGRSLLRALALGAVLTAAGCADPLMVAGNHPAGNAPASKGEGARAPRPPLLIDAEFFGQPVSGLDPELVRRLQRAETRLAAQTDRADADRHSAWVKTIAGYREGSRAHSEGRAVDINSSSNPYVMHEYGEEELDQVLGPIYHRIARLMLGRDSVIPEEITQGTPSPDRTMRLYEKLREESGAMAAYFRLMPDRTRLSEQLAKVNSRGRSDTLDDLAGVTPEALQAQMMTDYVTLAGRPGPPVEGLTYPEPAPVPGDRPLEGAAEHRAPEQGFLDLDRDLVRALTEAGIRWGGTDMANASGDLMHFFLPGEESSIGE
ncbi:MAG: hypothetical protein ACK47B_15650 [Armatimonadota bacterium]